MTPEDINASHQATLRDAYKGFNARDIDGVLKLMTADVSWPRAFNLDGEIHRMEIEA